MPLWALYLGPGLHIGWDDRHHIQAIGMFENDFPLLSTPSLIALILHRAEAGAVTLDGCAERLAALYDEAREAPALTPEAIRTRLAGHLRQLEIARLLEPASDGAWRLTDRGRQAIQRDLKGVDFADLMEYPEFAAHIRASAGRLPGMDPRAASYDEGYEAGREGRSFTANPYTANTVDHIAWENGWMQALDEKQ